jgi:hypothetical protein
MQNTALRTLALLIAFCNIATVAFAAIDYTTIFENTNGIAVTPFTGGGFTLFTDGHLASGAINTGSSIHNGVAVFARGRSYTIEVGGNLVDLCDRVELYTSATATVPRWSLINKPDNDPADKVKTRSGKISFNIGDVPLTEGQSFIIKIRYALELNGVDIITCTIGNGTITAARWVGTTLPTYTTQSGVVIEQLNQGASYTLELTISGLPANNLVNDDYFVQNRLSFFPQRFAKFGTIVNGVGTFRGSFTVTDVTNTQSGNILSNYSHNLDNLIDERLRNTINNSHALTSGSTNALEARLASLPATNQTTHSTNLNTVKAFATPPVVPQNPAGTNLVPISGGNTFNPVLNGSNLDLFNYRGENFIHVNSNFCAGKPASNALVINTDPILGSEILVPAAAENITWGIQDVGSNPAASYPTFSSQLLTNGNLLDTKTINTLPENGHQQHFTFVRPPFDVFFFPTAPARGGQCFLKATATNSLPNNANFEIRVDNTNTVQESNETDNNRIF